MFTTIYKLTINILFGQKSRIMRLVACEFGISYDSRRVMLFNSANVNENALLVTVNQSKTLKKVFQNLSDTR